MWCTIRSYSVFCLVLSVFAQEKTEISQKTEAKPTSRIFGSGFGHQQGFGQPGFGHQQGFGQTGFGHQQGFGHQPSISHLSFNPGFGGGVSSGCQHWCRTPHGEPICCKFDGEPEGIIAEKPGRCPLRRPTCHATRNFGQPLRCSNDGDCPGIEKCCTDACIDYPVCKTISSGFGFNPGFGGFGNSFGGGIGNFNRPQVFTGF